MGLKEKAQPGDSHQPVGQIKWRNISKQSLRAVLRTLIKIYTFAPNFKFGTK